MLCPGHAFACPPPRTTLFHLSFLVVILFLLPWISEEKAELQIAGLTDVMELRQALKALWAQRAECTEMRKDQPLAF